MAWRMLGCLLLGITYGLLTAGPKDKTALKIATVGQAMMLPLMAMAGFGTGLGDVLFKPSGRHDW